MKNILFLNEKSRKSLFEDSFYSKGELANNYNNDLDQIIHTYLIDLSLEDINSFILPISLNGNFFDFSGLMFAHHVRLTREIKSCDAKIVFYGVLEIEQLLRLTNWARVFLTPNVMYFNITKLSFDHLKEAILGHTPEKFILGTFLEKIQINPPDNYKDNHHNADNEFALIQWSKYIACYDYLPDNFKKEFDSHIYLKYLKQKNPLNELASKKIVSTQIEKQTKILLIDDESIKGWKYFYSSLFNNFSKNIEFKDSGIDFKNAKRSEIISTVVLKITEFMPDIVLLDLRLHDSDFDEGVKTDKITGIEILERIKDINRGIQVIITTASNKAWNFDIAKQKGAFDFIIKDGFESIENSIEKLISSIFIGAKRANFLKDIDQKFSNLRDLVSGNNHLNDLDDENKKENNIKEDKIRKTINSNIHLSFELLDTSYKLPYKQKHIAYSYLQLFLLIEDFVNPNSLTKTTPVLYEENNQIFVQHTLKNICILQKQDNKKNLVKLFFDKKFKIASDIKIRYERIDTNFLVSSILIYKYGNENSSVENWTEVNKTRNKVAHEGYIPDEIELLKLLKFILYLYNNSNESCENLEKGLVPQTYEDSLKALKAKYSK
jgi:CheY-like chemotaxis protein